MAIILTKSLYLNGLQCPKLLWTICHEKFRLSEPEVAHKHIFDQGIQVGNLAKTLFPKGIEIKGNYWDIKESDKKSREALNLKKPLFEAGFLSDGLYSRADILVPVEDKWDIIEVKSTTSVEEINYYDVAFQKYCYEKAGLVIRKCYLMHINKDYVRKGPVNAKQLFIKKDITKEVIDKSAGIRESVDEILSIISEKKCPVIKIGPQCDDPYECTIRNYCWSHVPVHSVFDLYRGGKRAFELYEKGVINLEEIPEDFMLSDKQIIQHNCAKTKKVHLHKEEIKKFLETLDYPLYFLDFETYCTAIPLYNKLRPYQNIPFQFSLHVVKDEKSPGTAPSAQVKHYSFIAQGEKDPRKEFIETLKPLLANKGSIIIYNQSFEIGVLESLIKIFPSYKSWLESIKKRIVDLLVPFRNFYYYNPKQQGSCSIKSVLPAITKFSYNNMEIAEGTIASLQYLYMTHGDVNGKKPSAEESAKIRKALEAYCGLDTMGMIYIIGKLKDIIK